MVNIDLNYNNAYKWNNIKNVYSIGYIFYNDRIYEDLEFTKLILKLKESDILEFIKKIEGCFSIIINSNNKVILISDLLRTFPVFYQIFNNNINIKDNIMIYQNKKLDKDNIKELSYCNYVTGCDTVFKDIYQLEGHQIVEINKNDYNIFKKKYFEYKYNFESKNDETLIKELDKVYDNVTKKMIKFLNGRQAVIPLSGGNDSRLIAYYLTKNNYKNIITYTYGSKENSEIDISRKVAEFLGIDWYFIEYKNNSMQKKFNNKKMYKEMANYCGRGYSSPVIQEWEAISQLLQENRITTNSVVLPGYSGDFLAGTHIFDDLFYKDKVTFKELIDSIYKKQYQYADEPIQRTNIKEKLSKELELKEEELVYKNKTIEIFEKFDFEERQVKYINNAIRIFDYHGLQWYLPFWDKELITKWLSIPVEKRYNIELFNKFTKTIYGDLMEYAPIYEKKSKNRIEPPFKTLKKIYRVYEIYKRGFLNFYGYLYFRTYLKYAFRTKNFEYNKIFSSYYIDYLKKEIKKENTARYNEE